jgi:hypothetical protein
MIFIQDVTPYLAGKMDGEARRKPRCPYEPGSQAAADYAAGYARGRSVQ